MWPKKLMWQLYLSYLLIMGVPVALVTWYAADSFTKFFREQAVNDLRARAYLIGSQMEEHCAGPLAQNVDSICKVLAKKVPTRFTVIAVGGKVIGDSEKNPDSMENHSTRPEIIAAFSGRVGISDRYSQTLNESMIYVAVPVLAANTKVAAVVRTSVPEAVIINALDKLYLKICAAVLLMALFAAYISYIVSRRISRPIARMEAGSQRFAAGDFSFKLPHCGYEEADLLASGLNSMAKQLSERLLTITTQRNELDAVMYSMIEGVIAVDVDERIITINRAAAQLFGIDQKSATGKWIGEAIRNIEVQDFLSATIRSDNPTECELILPVSPLVNAKERDTEMYLQLTGSTLRDGAQKIIGALLVINDITRIKKLENVRKDFVANVSHELRTPLTSIKGYVETLENGAVDNKEEAMRFLGIVSAQVDRLNTIVEDLLSLSQIEREGENRSIELSPGKILNVLNAAVEACRSKTEQKHLCVTIDCDKDLVVPVEASLLEQAVVNLLDNAIKYSAENKQIWINANVDAQKGEVAIAVRDEGIGIEKQHLDRLFERFYRVDKARSRKLGGTGLGLSIVKHIIVAHGGHVGVESVPAQGSTFILYLPATHT